MFGSDGRSGPQALSLDGATITPARLSPRRVSACWASACRSCWLTRCSAGGPTAPSWLVSTCPRATRTGFRPGPVTTASATTRSRMIESDGGGQAAEPCEDRLAEAGEGAGTVALEGADGTRLSTADLGPAARFSSQT